MRLPLLVFHVSAGVLAMFAGASAISFRKGSRWHGRRGNIFVVAMLCMAAAAAGIVDFLDDSSSIYRRVSENVDAARAG
jgi:hypothetical protein